MPTRVSNSSINGDAVASMNPRLARVLDEDRRRGGVVAGLAS
jgi:hypothetical protein